MTVITAPARSATAPAGDLERDAYQDNLVVVYQRELALAGGDPTAVSREGQRALADLLADLDGLLKHVTNAHLTKRFGARPDEEMFDEALAEARLACVAALATFDSSRGRFRPWVLSTRGGLVIEAIKRSVKAQRGQSWLSQGQEIAVRYAHAVRADLRASGCEPSSAQIETETLQRCLQWALERVDEQRIRDDEQAPQADQAELLERWLAQRHELAMGKLRKDGTLGAIQDGLGDLLAATQTSVHLDALTHETLAGTAPGADETLDAALRDELPEMVRVAVCGMTSAERAAVLEHMGIDVPGPVSAPSSSRSRARTDELVERSRALLAAPHAHFAALSPTLDLQFDTTAPARPGGLGFVAAVRAAALEG